MLSVEIPKVFRRHTMLTTVAMLAAAMMAMDPAKSATLENLYTIRGSGDGQAPIAGLVNIDDVLYGTTSRGGQHGIGAIFTVDPATGSKKILYSFAGESDGVDPHGSLLAVGGQLYGTTQSGGFSNYGTVFTVNPTTGTKRILYAFKGGKDGYFPQASLLAFNGQLYGTTTAGGKSGNGTVFTVDPSTGAEKVLHSFKGGSDGSIPFASLVALDGQLYGTASYGGGQSNVGILYQVDPGTGAEKVVHSFSGGHDGKYPDSDLIVLNDRLYGTTFAGGDFGNGLVYEFDPKSNTERVLHSFSGSRDGGNPEFGSLLAFGGQLYGTTLYGGPSVTEHFLGHGVVFSVNPKTGAETTLYSFKADKDGGNPQYASLAALHGQLYGTTTGGGRSRDGTVFAIDPKGDSETVLYSFAGAAESLGAGIINFDGKLFVSSSTSGKHGNGEILTLDLKTNVVSSIYSFRGKPDGAESVAALLHHDGLFYGTTVAGGRFGAGSVFAIDPKTNRETSLCSFAGGVDGGKPYGALIAFGGQLYGTTQIGGIHGAGTVFAIDAATGAKKVVYSFKGERDGYFPKASLVQFAGRFYGTTTHGGMSGNGVVFALTPKGTLRVLHSFGANGDDQYPGASLIVVDGQLYGTTTTDGRSGSGTVFTINPQTGDMKLLHSFSGGNDGGNPHTSLVASGGQLYGTASSGGKYNRGVVFTIDPATGSFRVAATVADVNTGSGPGPISVVGGDLYGLTLYGGGANLGGVFKLKP